MSARKRKHEDTSVKLDMPFEEVVKKLADASPAPNPTPPALAYR